MISVLSPLNLPQFPARSLPYFPGRVTHQFLQSPHRLQDRFSLLSLQSLCFEACFLLEQCRFVAIYYTNGGSVPNSAHSGTVPNYWRVITHRLLNCLAIVQYRFPVCNSTIGRIVLQSIDAVEIRIPAAEFNSSPLYNVQQPLAEVLLSSSYLSSGYLCSYLTCVARLLPPCVKQCCSLGYPGSSCFLLGSLVVVRM